MSLTVEIKKRLGDFLLEASFETEEAVTGLLGASGCGKSMTLKCIAGVERPDSGRIILDGVTLFDSKKRINLPAQERRVGYLFQNYALFPNMTVEQNILCGIRGAEKMRVKRGDEAAGENPAACGEIPGGYVKNCGRLGEIPDSFGTNCGRLGEIPGGSGTNCGRREKIPAGKNVFERASGTNPLSSLLLERKRRREQAAEIARLLQVEHLLKLRPAALSGGQAQRAALARILAGRPRLMLLDEPFSALDSCLKDQLQPEFKRLLLSLGCQTVMVTHSRDEAYRLCSRLSIMDQGRILKSGATEDVFSDPGSEAAARLTGCKNTAAAEKAGEYLVSVPSWGISLRTSKPAPDGIRAVGIRAHSFDPASPVNRFPARLCDAVEEPFEWILLFRYAGQEAGSPPLWWRMPKNQKPASFPAALGISPENVLLLE